MINTIRIRNFKSLKNLSLELAQLNVVTGMNGVGKSSLIQALLLIRQSFLRGEYAEGISLDGDLTGNLGSVGDIENKASDDREIEISINDCKCLFSTKDQSEETILRGKCNIAGLRKNALLSKDRFQYISASRIAPGAEFKKSSYNIENKQFGKSGEHVVSYIAEHRKIKSKKNKQPKAIINLVKDETGNDLPLESQINYWLNFVSEDVRLNIIKTSTTKYDLNFEFYNGTSWDSFSAENSAFGLTYSLPVITSLLAAAPGDIVVIENPESDLHPQAQSKFGELMARCANEGVQIIIETHSDHILNGIRVALSRTPSLLEVEKIKIFYFLKGKAEGVSKVHEIAVDNKGRIPIKDLKYSGIEGFFDQFDKDYMTLVRNQNDKVNIL